VSTTYNYNTPAKVVWETVKETKEKRREVLEAVAQRRKQIWTRYRKNMQAPLYLVELT